MRSSSTYLRAAAALLAVWSATSLAEDGGTSRREIEELDLESLLNQTVVTGTKSTLRATQVPAVVTVVTAEEIQARGYSSLADVLRVVPGFYDVYDLSTHNFGVRGITGGARASGSILKVMIDGHAVDYRPTTGNFFGEELIPIGAIERIEIIRGPASALFGANAFLGVVNLITRRGDSIGGARLNGQLGTIRGNPAGGVSAIVGAGGNEVDVLVAGSFHFLDRSGLQLPGSSPVLQAESSPLATAGPSAGDTSRPKSLYVRISTTALAAGRLTLSGSVQHLDTGGEFQELGPLSHRTRVSIINQNYRLLYEAQPSDAVSLSFSGSFFTTGPTRGARLDIGRKDLELVPNVGANGGLLTGEIRIQATSKLQLTAGVDFGLERQLTQSFDQRLLTDLLQLDGSVLQRAGTIVPSVRPSVMIDFLNGGAFVQAQYQLTSSVGLVAGARVDIHSIYGAQPNVRAGAVYAPEESPLNVKLLYGSSFKAPSAVQLYTQPMKVLDVRGFPQLKPQTAHTVEAAAGYAFPEGRAEVTVNAFVTQVSGRVEFVQRGLYQQARNTTDEWLLGGEAELRLNLVRSLSARLALGAARTVSRSTDPVLEGLPEVTNPLFPPIQVHLLADWQIPWLLWRLSPEVSFIGPRGASQSNALELGTAYTLRGYLWAGVSLSTPAYQLIPGRDTTFVVRVNNLLDTPYFDPGFGGIDVPAQGIGAFLTVSQTL